MEMKTGWIFDPRFCELLRRRRTVWMPTDLGTGGNPDWWVESQAKSGPVYSRGCCCKNFKNCAADLENFFLRWWMMPTGRISSFASMGRATRRPSTVS